MNPAADERSKTMFRRFRYRRWLVAGLGIAALALPTTALAGNVLDGRSPDTRDAASSAALAKVDPMAINYLLRYGYTLSQIKAMLDGTYQASSPQHVQPTLLDGRSPDTRDAAQAATQVQPAKTVFPDYFAYQAHLRASADSATLAAARAKVGPKTITYLLWQGYTPSQITTMLASAFQTSAPKQVSATPVDGRSPDTVDFAVQAHSPVVTVTRDPGFQWDDFGIGGAAGLGAMILVVLSVWFLSNRQTRSRETPVATA
jgi:hypothetical protein